MHRSWLRLWIAAATFALTLGFVLWRFEFSTDISAFLPTGDDRERAELSKQIVRSELSRSGRGRRPRRARHRAGQ